MEIGRLQHRIKISNYIEIENPANALKIKRFSTVYTLWSMIIAKSGVVYFKGAQTSDKITHQITIRWQANITAEQWIIFQSRYFRIRSIQDLDEKHRWLVLNCEEVGLGVAGFICNQNTCSQNLGNLI